MVGILLVAVLCVVLFVGFQADFLARGLVFHPPKFPAGDWEPEGVVFEEVSFPVESTRKTALSLASSSSSSATGSKTKKQTLVGWYFPHPDPKAVILYSHGNAANVTAFPGFAGLLRNRFSASVLVYDYRGYGKSGGTPSTSGILADGRAAANWLAAKEGVDVTDIVQWGQSLGGSVAVDLAADSGARGLIVESGFTSLPDMAKRISKALPAKTLLREELSSVDKIAKFRGPVFISHGKADGVIPYEQGERLFEAANEPKTFYTPPPGEDTHSARLTEEHLERLDAWFAGLSEGHQM